MLVISITRWILVLIYAHANVSTEASQSDLLEDTAQWAMCQTC